MNDLAKKPRIAILSIRNTYSHGGVLATIKTVYNFCQRYFDPTVFVLSFDKEISTSLKSYKFSSTNRQTSFEGMSCVEIGARWAFWEPGHYAATIKQWEQALEDYDYFFVVSATPIAGHPLALLNKKFPIWISTSYTGDRSERVKKMTGIRGLIDRLARPRMAAIEKTILEKASFIWALSSYSRQQFEKSVGRKLRETMLCPQPIKTSAEQSFVKDPTMLISVGRFSDPRKNVAMLLSVFEKLYQKNNALKLYLIGQKPEHELLEKYENKPSFNNIVFTGPVSNQELEELYKKATLKLITSYQEGFGIAGLEALSHGVPVVSTDCGGVRDFVLNGQTGYLVAINDVDVMVNKAHKILTEESLLKRLSINAQKIVAQHFSQERVYGLFQHGLVKVYPELEAVFQASVDHKAQQPVVQAGVQHSAS